MIRVPAKLRGNSKEAAWINQLREVVISLIPINSLNNKTSRTTKGTIHQGTAAGKSGGGGSGKAVWL